MNFLKYLEKIKKDKLVKMKIKLKICRIEMK